jgi:hypothetical protein
VTLTRISKKDLNAFRKKILKPLIEKGMKNHEIQAWLNADPKNRAPMLGGNPVTIHQVIYNATRALKRNKAGKRAARPNQPGSAVPTTGRLGLVSEVLTLPGLSESKRIEIIRALIGGS